MKLRYLFATLVAALTVFAGCEKEADHYLEEVQVSSSYIAFPAGGGTQELTVTAIGDWSIKDLPEWISSSAMAGAQGESTVRLTATAAEETREDSFSIECAGKAQTVNVIQVTEKQEPVTLSVAEALEIIKPLQDQQVAGGTYRVKGIVCKITEISPQYGNATFYISDDGSFKGKDKNDCNWLQVYRGLWLNGSAFTKGDEFAVGDILTIEGSLMDYKGTPETKEKAAFVVSVEKSLIGIDSIELLGVEDGAGVTEFPKEGGSIKITLNNKGNGFHVVIPEEAKSWLHIEDFGPDYVTLSADANNAGARNATVSFTTSADGVAYSCEQAFSQLGAISELSIADFLAKESGDPSQYRLTGVITENYASDSQGQSFYFRDWSDKTLVYRLNDYKASGATVGDIITVVGNRGDYKGSPQMVNGVYESHIATIKDKSLAEIAAAADATDVYYIATGTVKEIADEKWGNLWLSDGTTDLYVYGCYPGWGATGDNRHNQIANAGIKVGDKLSVIGIKTTFNDAPQIKNGVYFTHEAGEPAGGSITVDGNAADWEGIQGVASADCPAGAELTGIKSAKAYYGDKLYVLAEFSDEALAKGVADGKLRFHVFFSGADGLLSRFWADENIAYMMEGKATSGGSYTDFSSPLYKFTGATSADWAWDNSGVSPAVTSAGNGNIYEVAIDYSDYPGGFPEQVEIGIDCADGNYEVLGYAPQTSHKFVLKKGEVVDVPDDPTPGEKAPLFLNEFDT
ncbi:MAG: BACON domain-containing protein, partial [Bacteroidales bacterium]|nr:BACON domain-containing protein [Bacteroidales bacterium]